MSMLQRFASPARFERLSAVAFPWVAGIAAAMLLVGLYLAFFASPPDYQQGETVRIMYIHVPAAWMALFAYSTVAAFSAMGLVWKNPLAFIIALSAAPIGACFTFVCLTTGSLWGRPMWGAWWVWDARLTSVLILFFLYLGVIALAHAFDDPQRGERAAAILALVGAVNVPIIKFSVDWWNTLHQPASVVRLGGPAIDPSMLAPLLVMGLGFTMFFFAVLLLRVQAGLLARRLRALRLAQVHGAAARSVAGEATAA
jgi:heme exporter protein C